MPNAIVGLLILVLTISCTPIGSTSSSGVTTLADGMQLYFQRKHKEAYKVFDRVWEDSSQSKDDRANAARLMATMDWRFYRKYDRAYETLDQLEGLNYERGRAYILRARILAEEDRLEEAISWSEKAIGASGSKTEDYLALESFCLHTFAIVQEELLQTNAISTKSLARLKSAYDRLKGLWETNKASIELSQLYLGYSLLLEQGRDAIEVWKMYHRCDDVSDLHPSLLKSPDLFERVLLALDSPQAGTEDWETIIKGLAESGFYKYATLLKSMHFGTASQPNAALNDIAAYSRFCDDMSEIAEEFYIEKVSGRSTDDDLDNEVEKRAIEFWKEVYHGAKDLSYSKQRFDDMLKKRFKGYLTSFSANGQYGLHFGQMVLDDRRTISQYEVSAQFRYIVLDHMVSNGYTSWYADGDSEVGGWAPRNGSFLQVRSAAYKAPMELWAMISDPVERKKLDQRVEQMSAADDDIAKKNPHAFLPGLKFRIIQSEAQEMVDGLVASGVREEDLGASFIRLIEDIMEGSAIYAHEGRHAIDQQRGYSTVSKDLEYTAKLAEIYFSERPFLSLLPILSSNIGMATSHGQANERLVKELVRWMDEYTHEIAGFDHSRPTFPQLDKLTEIQLKEIVRSLDPLANGG